MKKLFKPNEGCADRVVRAIIGVGALIGTTFTTGLIQMVLLVVGIVLLFTSLTGYCLLYSLLDISTQPTKTKKTSPKK